VDAYFREALRVSEPKAPKVTFKLLSYSQNTICSTFASQVTVKAINSGSVCDLYMELVLDVPNIVNDTQTIMLK
jgi:hypothetical protein